MQETTFFNVMLSQRLISIPISKNGRRMIVGTIFIAGSYGVGKSTLCDKLSKALGLPTYSAGDLISSINGEQYGANKAVQNKETNQDTQSCPDRSTAVLSSSVTSFASIS